MNKTWLIIKREYTTRVFKKSFIVLTLLVPLLIVLFSVFVGWIMSRNTVTSLNVAVSDIQGMTTDSSFAKSTSILYTRSTASIDELKGEMKAGKYQAIVEMVPPTDLKQTEFKINIHTDEKLDINTSSSIESTISKIYRNYKLNKLNISNEEINNLNVDVDLATNSVFKQDKKQTSASNLVGAILGGVMMMLMYIFVLGQGMMVMRSVMEEKMTRIVEVILSSVKPMELMMGKIIGVGLVGLTQLLIWLIFMPLAGIVTSAFFGINLFKSRTAGAPGMEEAMSKANEMGIGTIMTELSQINWLFIVPVFFLLFILGYFLYASLCAAIGSAVGDDQAESQQLIMPITLIIIMALYIAIASIRAPHSQLAVVSSFIPFFSPIVMATRLAFDPPLWQVLTSLGILILTCYLLARLAAKIYRTGILMYGKKASYKEIMKWVFSK